MAHGSDRGSVEDMIWMFALICRAFLCNSSSRGSCGFVSIVTTTEQPCDDEH